MVGSEVDVLQAAMPVLRALCDRAHHVGPNGAGSAMKVIVNLMIGMTVLAVAETLTLGRQAGLDPRQMLEILGETAVSSAHPKNMGRMSIERPFEPAFALKCMQRDYDLNMEATHELRTPLFAGAIPQRVYSAVNVAGCGELAYASVIMFVEGAAALRGQESYG